MADTPAAEAPSAPTATQPAAPEAGAPTPPAAATEPKPVTQEDAFAQIDATESFDALAAELDKANAKQPKVDSQPAAEVSTTAPTPAPAAPATTDGSQPPAPAAAAPAGPGGDDNDESTDPATGEKFTKNFRLHTTDPALSRYLKLLKSEPGANPIDLAIRAGYNYKPSAAAAPEATPAAAPAAVVQSIDDALKPMRDEIAALTAQREEAQAGFEFGLANKLTDQIVDKKLALERRQSELEATAQYEAEFTAVYNEARVEAGKLYPDTLKPGTPQFEAVEREVAYLEAKEPGFFDDPQYPVELIKRLEKNRPDVFKSAAPAATPPGAPPVTPPAVTPPPNAQPRTPARPVGEVVAGNASQAPPLTRQATEEAIENITDPEVIAQLADAIGQKVKGRTVHR